MRRWKRAKRGNDGSKDFTRKRLTWVQRDTVLRMPTVCMSIQQETDSLWHWQSPFAHLHVE